MNYLANAPVLFQYPGNVIVVDDDTSFTEALKLQLLGHFTTTVFNSPDKAIHFFTEHKGNIADHLPIITKLKGMELDTEGFAYTIDYEPLVRLLGGLERYQEPTVLIVDYKMPEMTGLDFLSQIPNHKIKKILLTAHDEKTIALKAFNNGLIDKFVMKASTTLDDYLLDEISQLNQAYFQQVTTDILGKGLFDLLRDENYEQLFWDWSRKFNIIEYYRVDDYGTVLGVSKEGKIVWLVVQTSTQREYYIEVYDDENDKPLSKNKMIYLCSEIEKNITPDRLNEFVCDVQGQISIQGIPMYYSFVTDKPLSLFPMRLKKKGQGL